MQRLVCVCFHLPAARVGNVNVDVPEVGHMLEEPALYKGVILSNCVGCVQ